MVSYGVFCLCYEKDLPRFYSSSQSHDSDMNMITRMWLRELHPVLRNVRNNKARMESCILRSIPWSRSKTQRFEDILIQRELLCSGGANIVRCKYHSKGVNQHDVKSCKIKYISLLRKILALHDLALVRIFVQCHCIFSGYKRPNYPATYDVPQ